MELLLRINGGFPGKYWKLTIQTDTFWPWMYHTDVSSNHKSVVIFISENLPRADIECAGLLSEKKKYSLHVSYTH